VRGYKSPLHPFLLLSLVHFDPQQLRTHLLPLALVC
jgi:hypothetical protein